MQQQSDGYHESFQTSVDLQDGQSQSYSISPAAEQTLAVSWSKTNRSDHYSMAIQPYFVENSDGIRL